MELRETYTYTSDSGREYGILEKIANTDGANIFTVRSLDEENQPTRIIKQFKGHRLREIRFEEERRILTQLNQTNGVTGYPGVIKLYDSSEKNFFLILEYIRGGTLRDIIDKMGRLELPEGVTVIKSMSGTLADIFENHGIVHRDVKPENTLLSESASRCVRDNEEQNRSLEELAQPGEIKYCDFSLYLRYNRDTGKYESKIHDETKPGFFIGSLKYCSPEITKGTRGDERSDVWALGVIAYELLVDGGAFLDAKSPREVFSEINTFDFPRKIKRNLHGFEEVLYGTMQINPKDRLTAREIHDASSDFEKKLREENITEESEQGILNFLRGRFVRA